MNTKFDELISKHLNGAINEEEKQILAAMLRLPENQLYLASKIDEQFFDPSVKDISNDETGRQIFLGIQKKLKVQQSSQHSNLQKLYR